MPTITASHITLRAEFDQPQFLYPLGENTWPVLPRNLYLGCAIDQNLHPSRFITVGHTSSDLRPKIHHLTEDTSRPDLFQAEESTYHFPCSACIHVEGLQDHCRNCCHYAL